MADERNSDVLKQMHYRPQFNDLKECRMFKMTAVLLVLDHRLQDREFNAEVYSIADIAS